MKRVMVFVISLPFLISCSPPNSPVKVFDVHLHGSPDPNVQMKKLKKAGVYKVAVSSSWDLQNKYRSVPNVDVLYGLMLPCPNGKVPYSLQPCFDNGQEWPSLTWTEQQIIGGKIDFLGEILTQYYGISSSDSMMHPYYNLAQKHGLPAAIHTGGAGPDHGSPNFRMEMGSPALIKPILNQFPDLRVWIMHAGDQFYQETIALMKEHNTVYTDISVISNPDIVPHDRFSAIIKAFLDAGLEDRMMFGTDNGDIDKTKDALESLPFLTESIKKKIYYQNAETFFSKKR